MIYHLVDTLRERATYSSSMNWEPAIWYPRASAEIKCKLMNEEEYQRMKKLAEKMKRLRKL